MKANYKVLTPHLTLSAHQLTVFFFGTSQFSNICGTVYRQGNILFTPDGNSLLSPVGNRVLVSDLVK
jgi:periodic tryptophan protein 2